jgi:hypothetical protein
VDEQAAKPLSISKDAMKEEQIVGKSPIETETEEHQ